MMALRFFFAGCTSMVLFIGFDDLLNIWLGEKYILSNNILISFIIIFFILQVRQPVDCFKQAYGLYGDIWAPLVQSILNLLVSILCVLEYGVIGVLIGTIVSQFAVVMIWRPFYLFTYGFKSGINIYWKGFVLHLFYFFIASISFYYLSAYLDLQASSDIFGLAFKLIKSGLIFSLLYFLVLRLFSKGFKNIIKRFISLIKKFR